MQNEKISAARDFLSVIKNELIGHKFLYPASLVAWLNAATAAPSNDKVMGIDLVAWQHYGIVVGVLVPTLLIIKTTLEVIKLAGERKKGGK